MNEKIAIITGTSSGLGMAMALNLLERGFIVYGGSRSESSIEHENFIDLDLDVSNLNSVFAFYKDIAQETEVVDIFINNAGVCDMAPVSDTSTDDVLNQFSINALGSFNILKYFEPFIIEDETKIINILSTSAKINYQNTTAFTMAESAQKSFLEILEKEWAKYRVSFSNIFLGAVDTDIWQDYDSMDRSKMIKTADFLHGFSFIVDAPSQLKVPEITLLHKEAYL